MISKKLKWPDDFGAFLGSVCGAITVILTYFVIWMTK
jgi:hypothetical protein